MNSPGFMHIDPDRLDAETLRALLDYAPSTGEFTWKVQRGGTARPGSKAGSPDNNGYILIRIGNRNFKAHRLAWLYVYVYGEWPDGSVDHKLGHAGDNRILELRVLTQSQNTINAKVAVNNTSGTTGIHWDKRIQKWVARIHIKGRSNYLGAFASEDQARVVRLNAALRYVGGTVRAAHALEAKKTLRLAAQ